VDYETATLALQVSHSLPFSLYLLLSHFAKSNVLSTAHLSITLLQEDTKQWPHNWWLSPVTLTRGVSTETMKGAGSSGGKAPTNHQNGVYHVSVCE
jgi:hypothetical protein